MKKIILFISCFILTALASAQSPAFEWAKNFTNGGIGQSVRVDVSGNVYTTGYFQNTSDFDPGPGVFNLSSAGGGDIFISKLDASGNFVWAKQMGGPGTDIALGLALDTSGNVYITGYFTGTGDFDPGPGIINLVPAGGQDIFVSKLSTSGDLTWVKQSGGKLNETAYSLAVDIQGNVYTTGTFQDTVDFDPGAGIVNLITGLNSNLFISKLDGSGNFVWAKKLGSAGGSIEGRSIVLDAFSNVYTTGAFYLTSDFDPGPGVYNLSTTGAAQDVFVSKLDVSGNFLWAKKMGSSNSQFGFGITLDTAGNIFTTGHFYGTADFDPGPGVVNLVADGLSDIFVSKLNASGDFVWAKKLGGTDSETGFSIATDASGNVYTTGYFRGTVDFDPGAGVVNLVSPGNGHFDFFISILNAAGDFVWAKNMGGTQEDAAFSIALDPSGNIYTTGYFQGTVDFDPGAGVFNLTAGGGADIFVHKMSQCIMPSATINPGGTVSFCSGGNILLNANTGTGLSYQWKNNGNDISGATNSIYTATAAGSYSVVITNACGTAASSVVTVTVNSLPSATITPAGPTTFCSGGSVVLNAPVAANRTYQWKKGANLISGATLSSYTATTGGNYRVIVTNTVTGCSKISGSATTVTVNPLPAATITSQGPTTFCAGGSVVLSANIGAGLTYKWKKGSSFISGATLSNYTATTAGNYRVQVTNSNGCSKTSGLVAVSVPCKEGEVIPEDNFDVKVFPNPSSGDFTFDIIRRDSYGENYNKEKVSIHIYDAIGKSVLEESIYSSPFIVHHSKLSPGIYSAIIINGENKKVLKIIKIN